MLEKIFFEHDSRHIRAYATGSIIEKIHFEHFGRAYLCDKHYARKLSFFLAGIMLKKMLFEHKILVTKAAY